MSDQEDKANAVDGGGMEKATNAYSKSSYLREGNNSLSSLTNNPKGFDYRMEGSVNSGFDHRDNHDSFNVPPSPTPSKSLPGSGSNGNGTAANGGGDVGLGSGEGGGEANSFGIELQFLPPDQRPGLPGDLLAQLVEPEIEDDTEAAEALRANASIKVGKVGKVARSVNAQTVRKFVKRATLRGHGNKRGKPPRVPPGLTGAQAAAMAAATGHRISSDDDGNQIYVVQEGGYESDYQDDDQRSVASSSGSVEHKHHQLQLHHDHHHDSDDNFGAIPRDMFKAAALQIEDTGSPEVGTTVGSPPRDSVPSKRPSRYRSDRYTSVMTGDDQKDIPTEVVAATMEAGRKLLGGLDPHNMLQLQRWRRKKKGGKKQRKSYVKGKVIDGRHELYTLSIAVMLGVRTSIARTNTIISSSDGPGKRMLSPQDFMAEEKYEFAPKVCKRCVLRKMTCDLASCGTILTNPPAFDPHIPSRCLFRVRQRLPLTNYRIHSNSKITLPWPLPT
jgi:hypothetical protein